MGTRYPQGLDDYLIHVALGIYVAHVNNGSTITPEQAGTRARVLVKEALRDQGPKPADSRHSP